MEVADSCFCYGSAVANHVMWHNLPPTGTLSCGVRPTGCDWMLLTRRVLFRLPWRCAMEASFFFFLESKHVGKHVRQQKSFSDRLAAHWILPKVSALCSLFVRTSVFRGLYCDRVLMGSSPISFKVWKPCGECSNPTFFLCCWSFESIAKAD